MDAPLKAKGLWRPGAQSMAIFASFTIPALPPEPYILLAAPSVDDCHISLGDSLVPGPECYGNQSSWGIALLRDLITAQWRCAKSA